MGKDFLKDTVRRAKFVARRIWIPLGILLTWHPVVGEIGLDPPVQDLSLVIGNSVQSEISAYETHAYNFASEQQSFLRIDFYSPNTDLLVSIALPGGAESLEWRVIKRGLTPIASVLNTNGTYQLKVQSLGKNADSGIYHMEIKEIHPAAAKDSRQVAACTHLSDAARYRHRWTEADFKSAIREYEEALQIWRDLGDLEQVAVTLKNMADVWEIFAEWDTALSLYENAQAVYSSLNDLSGETEVVNAISILYINRGQYQKALDVYSPAHRATNDPWQRAQIDRNSGAAAWGMTELPKAKDLLNQALEAQKQLRDRTALADTLLYLGYANFAVKNLSAAGECFQESLDISKETENPREVALALTSLGLLSNISGENQEALDYYDKSLEIFETIGELSGRYMVLSGKAHVYLELGKTDKALQDFKTALGLVRYVGDRALEADILNYMGGIYRDLGDYPKSIECSRQAVEINKSLPSPQAEAYALLNLAKTEEVLGKPKESLENCTSGLALSEQACDQFLEGLFLNAIGHLHHESGRLKEALDYYGQALSLQQEAKDSVSMPGTLYNLARAERDTGNLEQARRYADQGIVVTESLRGKVVSPDLRGSFLASVHQRYELTIDLLMRPGGTRPVEQLDAEALKISEQARARSLLDMLAETQVNIREGVNDDLLERERLLRKELNTKAAVKMRFLKEKHVREEVDSLNNEIESIARKYQELRDRIRSKSPHYAGLTQPRTLDLRGIQQLVDEKTLLLEYELGEERSYLWAVTPTSLESHILPGRGEIETRVRRILALMLERQNQVEETSGQYQERIQKADAEYREEAADLSRILLGPVTDRLESKRLLVVAEGALHHLSFAALPKPDTAGMEKSGDIPYLIEDHEIVNLPSASILGILRQETADRPLPLKKVIVLADPVFEADDPRLKMKVTSMDQASAIPLEPGIDPAAPLQRAIVERGGRFLRLPGTQDEADSIMELLPEGSGGEFLGFRANRTVALGPELKQFQIVHFGTHGFIDDDNPELSGLVLSLFDEQGRSQEGYLRLHDIYNMKLPVELVVLSACNSAQGKEVRGEGLVGLVRGFMYAGAKRIMASLWKVDDKPTAELMKRFYQHLLKDEVTPARALQLAQLEMLKQQRRRAPYYWAAFFLQGEYR